MMKLQSRVSHSRSLLNQPNRLHRGMFKLNTKSDADSLLYLLSHLECDGHTVHMLTQWHLPPPLTNTLISSMHIPVHYPWLPGYIHVVQTILVILTMAGLFLNNPHIFFLKAMIKKLLIHCLHMHIPAHFPWLAGHICVTKTILVILTMAGLFLNRFHVCVCVCIELAKKSI